MRHRANPRRRGGEAVAGAADKEEEEEEGQKKEENKNKKRASKGGDVRGKASVSVDGEEDAPGGTKKPADDDPRGSDDGGSQSPYGNQIDESELADTVGFATVVIDARALPTCTTCFTYIPFQLWSSFDGVSRPGV